jgi:hypothetical protein
MPLSNATGLDHNEKTAVFSGTCADRGVRLLEFGCRGGLDVVGVSLSVQDDSVKRALSAMNVSRRGFSDSRERCCDAATDVSVMEKGIARQLKELDKSHRIDS